jgi:hypothetical protein
MRVNNNVVECFANGRPQALWSYIESAGGAIEFKVASVPHLVDVRWCLEAAFRFPILRRTALYIMLRYSTFLLKQRGNIGDVKEQYKAVQALDHFFQPASPIFRLAFYVTILGTPTQTEPTFETAHGSSSVTFGTNEFKSLWSGVERARDLKPDIKKAFLKWNTPNLEILTLEQLDNM